MERETEREETRLLPREDLAFPEVERLTTPRLEERREMFPDGARTADRRVTVFFPVIERVRPLPILGLDIEDVPDRERTGLEIRRLLKDRRSEEETRFSGRFEGAV